MLDPAHITEGNNGGWRGLTKWCCRSCRRIRWILNHIFICSCEGRSFLLLRKTDDSLWYNSPPPEQRPYTILELLMAIRSYWGWIYILTITTGGRKLLAFRLRTRIMNTAKGLCKSNIVNRMARGWQQRAAEYALQISRWSCSVHDVLSASMIFVCLGPWTSITMFPSRPIYIVSRQHSPGFAYKIFRQWINASTEVPRPSPSLLSYIQCRCLTLTEALSPMIPALLSQWFYQLTDLCFSPFLAAPLMHLPL